jgi:hypothetical protein
MAEKWADYLITAVRFNSAGTHIDSVQAREDKGDTAGPAGEASRTEVVTRTRIWLYVLHGHAS